MKQLKYEIRLGRLDDKVDSIVNLNDVFIRKYPNPKQQGIGPSWVFGIFKGVNYTWAPKSEALRYMDSLYKQGYDFYVEFQDMSGSKLFYWKPDEKDITRLLDHEGLAKEMNKEAKNRKPDSQLPLPF